MRERKSIVFKAIVLGIIACFLGSILPQEALLRQGFEGQAYAQSLLNLPPVGKMINKSSVYNPVVIKGIKVFNNDPLRFDFIIDSGDSKLKGKQLEKESKKLIKYFLASITVPEEDLWVNLSPNEPDRIIPNSFGLTEMGKDLLSQDYMLKQLTASLMYPEKGLGKKFWDRVYKKAYKLYGTTKIPINTFNKIWIVPEKAVVHQSNNIALITESHLKVMLEEDYLALSRQTLNPKSSKREDARPSPTEEQIKQVNDFSSEIVRNILVPEIEKEVNQGKNFANLRQIYHSMILAAWYKRTLKQSILSKVYADKNKIKGIDTNDPQIKEKIYNQYLKAFKTGVYNYIKSDFDPNTYKTIKRRYFSGGFEAEKLFRTDASSCLKINQVNSSAISNIMQTLRKKGGVLFMIGAVLFGSTVASFATPRPDADPLVGVAQKFIDDGQYSRAANVAQQLMDEGNYKKARKIYDDIEKLDKSYEGVKQFNAGMENLQNNIQNKEGLELYMFHAAQEEGYEPTKEELDRIEKLVLKNQDAERLKIPFLREKLLLFLLDGSDSLSNSVKTAILENLSERHSINAAVAVLKHYKVGEMVKESLDYEVRILKKWWRKTYDRLTYEQIEEILQKADMGDIALFELMKHPNVFSDLFKAGFAIFQQRAKEKSLSLFEFVRGIVKSFDDKYYTGLRMDKREIVQFFAQLARFNLLKKNHFSPPKRIGITGLPTIQAQVEEFIDLIFDYCSIERIAENSNLIHSLLKVSEAEGFRSLLHNEMYQKHKNLDRNDPKRKILEAIAKIFYSNFLPFIKMGDNISIDFDKYDKIPDSVINAKDLTIMVWADREEEFRSILNAMIKEGYNIEKRNLTYEGKKLVAGEVEAFKKGSKKVISIKLIITNYGDMSHPFEESIFVLRGDLSSPYWINYHRTRNPLILRLAYFTQGFLGEYIGSESNSQFIVTKGETESVVNNPFMFAVFDSIAQGAATWAEIRTHTRQRLLKATKEKYVYPDSESYVLAAELNKIVRESEALSKAQKDKERVDINRKQKSIKQESILKPKKEEDKKGTLGNLIDVGTKWFKDLFKIGGKKRKTQGSRGGDTARKQGQQSLLPSKGFKFEQVADKIGGTIKYELDKQGKRTGKFMRFDKMGRPTDDTTGLEFEKKGAGEDTTTYGQEGKDGYRKLPKATDGWGRKVDIKKKFNYLSDGKVEVATLHTFANGREDIDRVEIYNSLNDHKNGQPFIKADYYKNNKFDILAEVDISSNGSKASVSWYKLFGKNSKLVDKTTIRLESSDYTWAIKPLIEEIRKSSWSIRVNSEVDLVNQDSIDALNNSEQKGQTAIGLYMGGNNIYLPAEVLGTKGIHNTYKHESTHRKEHQGKNIKAQSNDIEVKHPVDIDERIEETLTKSRMEAQLDQDYMDGKSENPVKHGFVTHMGIKNHDEKNSYFVTTAANQPESLSMAPKEGRSIYLQRLKDYRYGDYLTEEEYQKALLNLYKVDSFKKLPDEVKETINIDPDQQKKANAERERKLNSSLADLYEDFFHKRNFHRGNSRFNLELELSQLGPLSEYPTSYTVNLTFYSKNKRLDIDSKIRERSKTRKGRLQFNAENNFDLSQPEYRDLVKKIIKRINELGLPISIQFMNEKGERAGYVKLKNSKIIDLSTVNTFYTQWFMGKVSSMPFNEAIDLIVDNKILTNPKEHMESIFEKLLEQEHINFGGNNFGDAFVYIDKNGKEYHIKISNDKNLYLNPETSHIYLPEASDIYWESILKQIKNNKVSEVGDLLYDAMSSNSRISIKNIFNDGSEISYTKEGNREILKKSKGSKKVTLEVINRDTYGKSKWDESISSDGLVHSFVSTSEVFNYTNLLYLVMPFTGQIGVDKQEKNEAIQAVKRHLESTDNIKIEYRKNDYVVSFPNIKTTIKINYLPVYIEKDSILYNQTIEITTPKGTKILKLKPNLLPESLFSPSDSNQPSGVSSLMRTQQEDALEAMNEYKQSPTQETETKLRGTLRSLTYLDENGIDNWAKKYGFNLTDKNKQPQNKLTTNQKISQIIGQMKNNKKSSSSIGPTGGIDLDSDSLDMEVLGSSSAVFAPQVNPLFDPKTFQGFSIQILGVEEITDAEMALISKEFSRLP